MTPTCICGKPESWHTHWRYKPVVKVEGTHNGTHCTGCAIGKIQPSTHQGGTVEHPNVEAGRGESTSLHA